jgi:hypothetical protein
MCILISCDSEAVTSVSIYAGYRFTIVICCLETGPFHEAIVNVQVLVALGIF